MSKNKLSFKNTNITVDWIGFKFQNLDNFAQTKLAEYLFKIGFNSYQESGKLAKPVKESIFVSSKNKFQVLFVYPDTDCLPLRRQHKPQLQKDLQ